ncbi:hypothetical protein Xekj_00966 [Xenorhabdus sp. KJ12.1]|nr:hypothetical protein Xekj_00966 [Xenorhabdus sp. KJ12.1]
MNTKYQQTLISFVKKSQYMRINNDIYRRHDISLLQKQLYK